MKTGDRITFLMALGLVGILFIGTPASLVAGEQERNQFRIGAGDNLDNPAVLLRLRQQIRTENGLTEAEMKWFGPVIDKSLALNGGDPEPVREMFQKALGEGCTGDCLMERLRHWNRSMEQNQQMDDQGIVAARERTRSQVRDMNDDADGDQVRERNREQTREQAQDASGDQTQERSQEQNQEQNSDSNGSSPSGGGSGGGKGR